MNIRMLLREGLTKKQYMGQCDALRRQSPENERYWHEMMAAKRQIPVETFTQSVDMQAMLDDDESPEGYIADSLQSDPDTATYASKWGNHDVMFLQTAGFEFIFA